MASDTEIEFDEYGWGWWGMRGGGMRSEMEDLPRRDASWWAETRTLPAQSQMSIQSSLQVQTQWLRGS